MIVVFWLNESQSCHQVYPDDATAALKKCEELRKNPMNSHIVTSAELSGQVGRLGVDTVLDGKTPDGIQYTWSKADRAGKPRHSDSTKPSLGKRDGN